MKKVILGVTLYDVEEITKILELSAVTVRAYFKAGRIRGNKIGRNWWADEEALQDFLRGK
jgi:predicted site-specific integrase-resolvase